MSELRQDTFARTWLGRSPTGYRRANAPVSLGLVVSVLVALCLLVLSRVEHGWLLAVRAEAAAAIEPALRLARLPVTGARRLADSPPGDSALLAAIGTLKRQNEQLRQTQQHVSALEDELKELRRLVGRAPERQIGTVTGRVYIEGRSAFVASAIIDVGAQDGVRPGHAVVDASGLAGTIVETGARSARVLLVNDRRSRIPVFVGRERLRGIVGGRGDDAPALELVRSAREVTAGALVMTSGEDGILPRGLVIGYAETVGSSWVVRPNAALDRLDFVSVLLYEAPGGDLAESGPAINRAP